MKTTMTIPANPPGNNVKEPTVDIDTPEGKIAVMEAILFVSKDPVEPERIMNYLDITDVSEFDNLVSRLMKHYQEDKRGIFLKRAGGGLQLATKPILHEFLQDFFSIKTSSRLTIASLETLSIVAYRQPVTIAEISDLRGVNSVGPVKNLLQKKLIKISGRKKVPGNPALYSTTKEFILYFGLKDLSELPSLEELTEMFDEKEQPSLFK
jgi:segregation and condensation protein B